MHTRISELARCVLTNTASSTQFQVRRVRTRLDAGQHDAAYRPTEKQRPRGATGTRSPPENYGLSEKEIIPGKIGTQRDVNDYRMMIIISGAISGSTEAASVGIQPPRWGRCFDGRGRELDSAVALVGKDLDMTMPARALTTEALPNERGRQLRRPYFGRSANSFASRSAALGKGANGQGGPLRKLLAGRGVTYAGKEFGMTHLVVELRVSRWPSTKIISTHIITSTSMCAFQWYRKFSALMFGLWQ